MLIRTSLFNFLETYISEKCNDTGTGDHIPTLGITDQTESNEMKAVVIPPHPAGQTELLHGIVLYSTSQYYMIV